MESLRSKVERLAMANESLSEEKENLLEKIDSLTTSKEKLEEKITGLEMENRTLRKKTKGEQQQQQQQRNNKREYTTSSHININYPYYPHHHSDYLHNYNHEKEKEDKNNNNNIDFETIESPIVNGHSSDRPFSSNVYEKAQNQDYKYEKKRYSRRTRNFLEIRPSSATKALDKHHHRTSSIFEDDTKLEYDVYLLEKRLSLLQHDVSSPTKGNFDSLVNYSLKDDDLNNSMQRTQFVQTQESFQEISFEMDDEEFEVTKIQTVEEDMDVVKYDQQVIQESDQQKKKVVGFAKAIQQHNQGNDNNTYASQYEVSNLYVDIDQTHGADEDDVFMTTSAIHTHPSLHSQEDDQLIAMLDREFGVL